MMDYDLTPKEMVDAVIKRAEEKMGHTLQAGDNPIAVYCHVDSFVSENKGAIEAIATAAVEKYQEWLAKPFEKPCLTCDLKNDCIESSQPGWCVEFPYGVYLGQQQGYAKAMQERGK